MNKKRWILYIGLIFSFENIFAQDWNPYVSQAIIGTAPLTPREFNGVGTASFKFGNTGSSILTYSLGNEIILKVTFSDGVPYNAAAVDPFNPTQAEALAVMSGTALSIFNWTYDPGTKTFDGTQKNAVNVPGNFEGTVLIPYKVTINSSISQIQNGFNVNLTPPGYTNGINSTDDDQVSSYTWVEAKDFGDAPASYGSVQHTINIYKTADLYLGYFYMGASVDPESTDQNSSAANGDDNNQVIPAVDDEDGVIFPVMTPGATVTIPVVIKREQGGIQLAVLNAWIDWNGDGDFLDAGEQIAADVIVIFTSETQITQNISVTIPVNATLTPTYARFRLGDGVGSSGTSTYGEVEDYQILISSALPATGMELSVNLQNNISHLKWYTLSEQNTNNFVVERSLDGRTFVEIKSNIKAAGSSFSRIDYSYDDDITSLPSAAVVYYKVKLVDRDGTFSYTNVVMVRLNTKEGISVWPNPFTTNLTVNISTQTASQYNMKLMTITGQQLMTKKVKVSPGTTIVSLQNLDRYAKGTYVLFIERESNSSVQVLKVVKF